jgi:ATP-binding cassette subfamily F protein 3
VILVTHDFHLLGLVADRLWLVSGGTVAPYDGDLESYRTALTQPAQSAPKKPAKPRPGPSKERLTELRSDAKRCEARVEKLTEMREKLAKKLADPALYAPERAEEAAVWQRKYAEVMEGLERAEALWVRAMERLEAAETA